MLRVEQLAGSVDNQMLETSGIARAMQQNGGLVEACTWREYVDTDASVS